MSATASLIRWIPVERSKGMFSSESLAKVTDCHQKTYSVLVDNDLFRREEGGDQLKVYLVRNGKKKKATSTVTVLLPTEAMEIASCWLEVEARSVAK